MRDRETEIMHLRDTSFDLLIVGGGVHGAAIACEAARSGARVAVIDRADFASGASSNSLKILHGGFRYLRQFDLARMRSSIRCRRQWAQLAPDLVRPLPCAIAATGYGARNPLPFAAALAANDIISADRNRGLSRTQRIPRGRLLRRAQYDEVARHLLGPVSSPGALWWDAVALDTEALVVGLIERAAAAGACAANYIEARELLVSSKGVRGVSAWDVESGEAFEIRASHTICAVGAGENGLTTALDRHAGVSRPACWAVNVVSKARSAADVAIAAYMPDSRHLFFVPWRERTMIGTHYLPCSDSQDESEQRNRAVSELLGLANSAAPAGRFEESDICFVHWGKLALERQWRGTEPAPLLNSPRLCDYGRVASMTGLWSIEGPKFTSALDVARRTVQQVLGTHSGSAWAAISNPSPGVNRVVGADPETSGADAAKHLAARKLEDTVLRRTGLGSAGHPGTAVLEACARGMSRTLGWDAERTRSEVQSLSQHYRERHSGTNRTHLFQQEKP
jgi:glycerol-3-phosphate dehydrogenase